MELGCGRIEPYTKSQMTEISEPRTEALSQATAGKS
jgi:hypothetical protein